MRRETRYTAQPHRQISAAVSRWKVFWSRRTPPRPGWNPLLTPIQGPSLQRIHRTVLQKRPPRRRILQGNTAESGLQQIREAAAQQILIPCLQRQVLILLQRCSRIRRQNRSAPLTVRQILHHQKKLRAVCRFQKKDHSLFLKARRSRRLFQVQKARPRVRQRQHRFRVLPCPVSLCPRLIPIRMRRIRKV